MNEKEVYKINLELINNDLNIIKSYLVIILIVLVFLDILILWEI